MFDFTKEENRKYTNDRFENHFKSKLFLYLQELADSHCVNKENIQSINYLKKSDKERKQQKQNTILLKKYLTKENINFIEYKNGISDLSYFSIKPINLMVCIMVIELIPSKDVIELFKFASKNIENN